MGFDGTIAKGLKADGKIKMKIKIKNRKRNKKTKRKKKRVDHPADGIVFLKNSHQKRGNKKKRPPRPASLSTP